MHNTTLTTFFIAIFLYPTWTFGQNIYRCGNHYTDQPCAGGKTLELPPVPSAEQTAQARAVAAADKRLTVEMRNERLHREAMEARALRVARQPARHHRPASVKDASGHHYTDVHTVGTGTETRLRHAAVPANPMPKRKPARSFVARLPH